MLTNCPECSLQVSDKANSCPHCGYPLKRPSARAPSRKRQRLPNGFGQISLLRGRNLRKPYRAMVTVGISSEGRPIQKLLKPEAYFSTYNEAYAALIKYNANPYDISKTISMEELYERWSKDYFPNISPGDISSYKNCWRYFEPLYGTNVRTIRARHLKEAILHASANGRNITPNLQMKSKILFNLMFDYAVEYEITDMNYARNFNLPPMVRHEVKEKLQHHTAITRDELEILWNNRDIDIWVDALLIQCYSGWRPNELLSLQIENISLEEGIFVGGSKTEAGKDRPVPIHSRIRPLVESLYHEAVSEGRETLFKGGYKANPLYHTYRLHFLKMVEKLGLNKTLTLHSPRCTFATMAKECGVDEYALKYMLGHAIKDLTEGTYTTRSIDWLKTEIEKIR